MHLAHVDDVEGSRRSDQHAALDQPRGRLTRSLSSHSGQSSEFVTQECVADVYVSVNRLAESLGQDDDLDGDPGRGIGGEHSGDLDFVAAHLPSEGLQPLLGQFGMPLSKPTHCIPGEPGRTDEGLACCRLSARAGVEAA